MLPVFNNSWNISLVAASSLCTDAKRESCISDKSHHRVCRCYHRACVGWTHSEGLDVFAEKLIHHLLRQQRIHQVDVILCHQIWVTHHLHTGTHKHSRVWEHGNTAQPVLYCLWEFIYFMYLNVTDSYRDTPWHACAPAHTTILESILYTQIPINIGFSQAVTRKHTHTQKIIVNISDRSIILQPHPISGCGFHGSCWLMFVSELDIRLVLYVLNSSFSVQSCRCMQCAVVCAFIGLSTAILLRSHAMPSLLCQGTV